MRIEILDEAREGLSQGSHFYESREPGLGSYFIDYYRCLSKRFPFAIYYSVAKQLVRVHAVLDCHQNVTIVSLNSLETLVA